MPQPKNTALRLLVPAILIVVGIGVAWAIIKSVRNPPGSAANAPATAPATALPSAPPPQPAAAPAGPGQQSPTETTAAGNQPSTAQPPPAPAPTAPQSTPAAASAPVATGYHVVPVQSGPAPSLGSLDPTGKYKAEIEFSTAGSGVGAIWLTDHVEVTRTSKQQQVPKEQHVQAQRSHSVQVVSDKDGTNVLVVYVVDGQVGSGLLNGKEFPSSRLRVSSGLLEVLDEKGAVGRTIDISSVPVSVLVPFAALAIEITPPGGQGVIVPLAGTNVWQADKPGRFEAVIADDAGTPVLRLTREYSLAAGSLDVVLTQNLTNLSPEALSVRYYEAGPVDLPQDALGYGGDKRRVRFGYLLPKTKDPTQAEVIATDYVLPRAQVLGKREAILQDVTLWPDDRAKNDGFTQVWGGMTNRYFGVAAHPMCDPNATGPSKTLDWVDKVSRVVLDGGPGNETLGLRLESKPLMLAGAGKPGSAANFTHGFFVGPLDRSEVDTEPLLKSLGIAGLVVFNFGGPCGFCTFVPISEGLLWILHTLHDRVFHDWSLAIIFLVLIVRTCLHPVTKWSQIKMARFGKQMAAIGPKQKVIQEKYKDDPLKLREETSKLWREEGISPAGFLGCLPMFLQTPVWIALYAVLYFSVEMRNQPAFYGLFQHIQPGGWATWQFLGNLSEADRLLYFGHTVATVPILGPIQSFNVLPILLAVVFFIQQKYLTPPTAATMTPEQEFQQKMMKWMTVFMFPVFMYNAPSGLAIYFICNSTFAILESKYIRSHMDKYDMLNVEKMRQQRMAKKQVAGGWMARLQAMAEDRQKDARKRAGLPPGGVRRKP